MAAQYGAEEMVNKLFDIHGNEVPKRPDSNDNCTRKEIVKLAIDLMYKSKYCPFEDDKRDDLEETVLSNFSSSDDEYELAKQFERDGWYVNRDFISNLEEVTSWISSASRQIEKEWFEKYQPVPPLSIGSEIKFYDFKGMRTGFISGIYEHGVACYLVPTDDTGKSHRIIKFEDAELSEE